jgi:hypothetical protein
MAITLFLHQSQIPRELYVLVRNYVREEIPRHQELRVNYSYNRLCQMSITSVNLVPLPHIRSPS